MKEICDAQRVDPFQSMLDEEWTFFKLLNKNANNIHFQTIHSHHYYAHS